MIKSLKSLFYFFAVSSLLFAGRGSLDEFKIINRKKLSQDIKALVMDKEVDGFMYTIQIEKTKEKKVDQNAFVTTKFAYPLNDSARKALLNKYNKGEVTDSVAVMSELVKLVKDTNIVFSRQNYSVIVDEIRDSIYVNYSKYQLIGYSNNKKQESRPFYKEIIPKQKLKKI